MAREADDSRVWKIRVQRVRPNGFSTTTDSILEYYSTWDAALGAAKKHSKAGNLLFFGEFKATKTFRITDSGNRGPLGDLGKSGETADYSQDSPEARLWNPGESSNSLVDTGFQSSSSGICSTNKISAAMPVVSIGQILAT
jgi:hypothetical protein